jgi:CRISPR-associated protein Csd2
MTEYISRREGILLVDIENGNPQGDPDADNRPRTDPETSHGLITASGIKRKIRDRLALSGLPLYIARGACLERQNLAAASEVGCAAIFEDDDEEPEGAEGEDHAEETESKPARRTDKGRNKGGKKIKPTPETSRQVFDALAEKFIDFRFFGGTVPRLIGTGRGPIQFTMGKSIDPVTPVRMAITRVAVATEKEAIAQNDANRGMGGLWYIPYGLYRFHWFVSPSDAQRTKMTEADYDLFVKSVLTMFDDDRSSVRTGTAVRLFYEFRHDESQKGNLAGMRLLERVRVRRKDMTRPARSFADYAVEIHPSVLASGDLELRKIVDVETADDDIEKAAE